jgi:glutathione S-transferase
MLEDEEALGEMVPRALRRSLGRAGSRIGAMGIRRTLRKYGADGPTSSHGATRSTKPTGHATEVAAMRK